MMHTVCLIDDSDKLPFIFNNKQNYLLQKLRGVMYSPTYTSRNSTYILVAVTFKPSK